MKDTLHDDMNELENTASVHEHEDDWLLRTRTRS